MQKDLISVDLTSGLECICVFESIDRWVDGWMHDSSTRRTMQVWECRGRGSDRVSTSVFLARSRTDLLQIPEATYTFGLKVYRRICIHEMCLQNIIDGAMEEWLYKTFTPMNSKPRFRFFLSHQAPLASIGGPDGMIASLGM